MWIETGVGEKLSSIEMIGFLRGVGGGNTGKQRQRGGSISNHPSSSIPRFSHTDVAYSTGEGTTLL